MTKKIATAEVAVNDRLVPDRVVRSELCIAPMTMWRWDHDPAMAELGWPPVIQLSAKGRKYRSRVQLEAFKQNLVKRAAAARGSRAA